MDTVQEACIRNLTIGVVRPGGATPRIGLTGYEMPPKYFVDAHIAAKQGKGVGRGYNVSGTPYPESIHIAQYKYMARELLMYCFPADSPNASVAKRLGHSLVNKSRYEKLRKKIRAPFASAMLGSFYSRKRQQHWWMQFREFIAFAISIEDEVKMIWRVSQLIRDAMCPVNKQGQRFHAFPMEYRTTTVIGIVRMMRATERFDFPILADALQDAGADNDVGLAMLMSRYRNPESQFSLGSWIFKATGNLEYTGGPRSNQTDSTTPPDGD